MSITTPVTLSKPAFWKPGTAPPPTGSSLDRSSESTPFLPQTRSSTTCTTSAISSSHLQIIHALESSQIVILISPTSANRSTHLPLLLHTSSWSSPTHGIIGITQPRRTATISLASHVSSLLSCPLGSTVGYSVPFEDHSSPSTRIKYLTDEALFRELIRDPLLTHYSVVVVDEAQERSAWSDLLLAMLKKVIRRRRELRIVVSCATDGAIFKDFFQGQGVGGVKVIKLDDRTYPVDIAYLKQPCQDYVREMVETMLKIHSTEPMGDILAFLPSREEVEFALQLLSDRQLDLPPSESRFLLLPLHAGLSASEQESIFSSTPPGQRKVVVATNSAEASITIPNITYVVDCGLEKLPLTSPDGIQRLASLPTSHATAARRAIQAGQVGGGRCFRLYTEQYFSTQMPKMTPPELNRVDLTRPVLMLKSLGIDNLVRFDWIPPAPPPESLARALQRLLELEALDESTRLTQRGEWMADLPLPPHLGRILIGAAEEGCAKEMLSVVAMMQITSPFWRLETIETKTSVRQFIAQEGDLFTLLNVYVAFTNDSVGRRSAKWCSRNRLNFQALSRAVSICNQLEKYLIRFSNSPGSGLNAESSVLDREDAIEKITRVLAKGLYANLAKYDEATMTYTTTVGGETVHPHPSSVFFNRKPDGRKRWILFGEATQGTGGSGEAKTYIRDITLLGELEWLFDSVPGFYSIETKFGKESSSTAIPISGINGAGEEL
ncbi:related to PRP43 - spliceosomal RNA helicase (DEAH-box family) [Ustilago sp. UG-2017b]|nr:related to PRP43 - spliceosomal RNA helicase (DEAH-box family) [Ustilago sp. UG-2017b]